MWISQLNGANGDMKPLEYAQKYWPKVSDAEKEALAKQRDANIKKGIDDFLAKYLNEQEFTDHYKGDFGNVRKEVRTLLTDVSGMVFKVVFTQ